MEAGAVIDPKHGRGSEAKDPKLHRPKQAPVPTIGGKAITMECDVTSFIPEDEGAHRFERRIVDMLAKDAVIGRAHQLREQEDLKF